MFSYLRACRVIMQAMIEGVKASLKGGRPVLSRAISCGLAEGHSFAKRLGEISPATPTSISAHTPGIAAAPMA